MMKVSALELLNTVAKISNETNCSKVNMNRSDLKTVKVIVAKEDVIIFLATNEYPAQHRPSWQTAVSRAMLNQTNCISDRGNKRQRCFLLHCG